LGKLEDANDTFPNMFPKSQYLQESEIKHGRMSMLAWTGVWATHVVSFNLQAFPLTCSPVYYFFQTARLQLTINIIFIFLLLLLCHRVEWDLECIFRECL
jgi:hypothetical protein